MELSYAGATDVGVKRDHNEDSIKLDPGQDLYLVADGMGGYSKGDIASSIAVDTIAEYFASDANRTRWPYKSREGKETLINRLTTSIKLANQKIYQEAQSDDSDSGPMGTTVVGIHFDEKRVYVGYVGDSRIYRMRGSRLTQISEDHSLLNDYKRMKGLTDNEIDQFPYNNVIVRALGMDPDVKVDSHHEHPNPEDLYLLCSDGLTDEVEDQTIKQLLLKTSQDLDNCVEALIDKAKQNGGKDNISALAVRVEDI